MNFIEHPIFLYGTVFFAALLLVEAFLYIYSSGRRGKVSVNRRLRMLSEGRDPRSVYNALWSRPPEWVNNIGWLAPYYFRLEKMVHGAGIAVKPTRVLIWMVLATLLIFFFATPVLLQPQLNLGLAALPATTAAAFLGGVALPVLVLHHLHQRRLNKFAEQFPVSLDVMVRALRAGHPVAAAVELVTQEMGDPLGTEFGIMADEITYGLDFRQALDNLAERVELEDVRYFAVSVSIQVETGGNLAEVLNQLSQVIRARFTLGRKVKALSSEARISAVLLSILPVLTVLLIVTFQPKFYLRVIDDPLFWPIAIGIMVNYIIGVIVIRRMVQIKV